MVTCAWCGRLPESDVAGVEVPLGWMLEVDDRTGRRSVVCPACARHNVRAIEGKLDQAWW